LLRRMDTAAKDIKDSEPGHRQPDPGLAPKDVLDSQVELYALLVDQL